MVPRRKTLCASTIQYKVRTQLFYSPNTRTEFGYLQEVYHGTIMIKYAYASNAQTPILLSCFKNNNAFAVEHLIQFAIGTKLIPCLQTTHTFILES